MKNKFIKFAGVAVVALACVQAVSAAPIVGTIGFTGRVALDTSTASTASQVVAWVNPKVNGTSGDFSTLADGTEFDSSYARGQPASFQLDQVIKCWTEGLQRMRIGGHAVLVCPPGIAYGSRGSGGSVPPNATLTFEVELLGIFGR